MKICIIATHYLPHIGGLELATYHLANELSKIGHELHIITPHASEKKDIGTIQIHRMNISNYPSGNKITDLINGIIFFIKTIKCIIKIRPDIIQAQNITNSVPAYLAGRITKKPYCICIHGNLELMGPFLPKRLEKSWPRLMHIKHASKIIVLTKDMAEITAKALNKDPSIIPNGIDTNNFYPNNKYIDTSKNTNKIIICISRIDDKKGLEYAIESMCSVIQKYPNTTLKIVGDGEYKSELEKLTAKLHLTDNIIFSGLIPNTEVPKQLRAADIFLLPSLYEGLPLTLLEAMACGLPIISTPVSIAPEIVNSWHNGFIVPYKSPDAISLAIIDLFDNPNKRIEYGKKSAEAAKNTHSWTSIAKQYESLYNQIITKTQ